ncbi:MAG: WzyE family oligosaccharide polymerase [Arsenophonus sp. NC-WZS1-MAG3]
MYLLVFYFNFPLIGLLVFKFDINIISTNILLHVFVHLSVFTLFIISFIKPVFDRCQKI